VTDGRDAPSRSPLWLRFVGPIAACVLLSRVDLGEVAGALAGVRAEPLAVSLVLAAPLFVVKAWRWRLLLRACGQYISLRDASWLYTIAAGAGALTPGAVGDFWKGLSPGVGGRSIGLWTSAIDRLYDITILLVLAMTIATAWSPHGTPRLLVASFLGATVLGAFAARRRLLDLATSLLPRFPQAADALHGSGGAAAAATIVATIIAFGRFELLVVALGLPLAWPQVFIAFVLSSGVAALPLSVAGVGTRDLALLGYLRGCGVSSADAIALSSLCLSLFLWNGVVAACLWFAKPVRTG
jgi:glycosyltransferase 2 family protein